MTHDSLEVDSLELLITQLRRGNESERGEAAYHLVAMVSRAVVPLIEALQESKAPTRRSAARALGRIGDTRALKALRKAAQQDEDERVRERAKEALKLIAPIRQTIKASIEILLNKIFLSLGKVVSWIFMIIVLIIDWIWSGEALSFLFPLCDRLHLNPRKPGISRFLGAAFFLWVVGIIPLMLLDFLDHKMKIDTLWGNLVARLLAIPGYGLMGLACLSGALFFNRWTDSQISEHVEYRRRGPVRVINLNIKAGYVLAFMFKVAGIYLLLCAVLSLIDPRIADWLLEIQPFYKNLGR